MREIELDDVRADLSRIIDEATQGRSTVITRHGKREAVVLGYDEWQQLSRVPSFGRLLMSAPVEAGDLPRRRAQ
ncbi:type II toxin-antitoxin system Phd/YefM family antitoxin [Bradyrhizobium sp. S69]|uniref:type II toxin-antitoxin system Phd/YefM family antitoxin n=1 Tax=Bradyrhizobium sp. S69 TaxID=1641856 RepID=UPI00131A619E|nr:type II toxin-antitoxin system Phd/YefM family antitoxin [Bradyrhizobium sp. S69]